VLKLKDKLPKGASVRGIQMVKEHSSSYSLPMGPILRGLSKTTGYTETQVMSMKCKIVLECQYYLSNMHASSVTDSVCVCLCVPALAIISSHLHRATFSVRGHNQRLYALPWRPQKAQTYVETKQGGADFQARCVVLDENFVWCSGPGQRCMISSLY
jgi:hypothetical protein